MSKLVPIGNLEKDGVVTDDGKNLGKIDNIIIDLDTGRIAFAVLSFGGFPNRTKLFAVPMELLTFSSHDRKFIFNIEREMLEKSAGYDTLEQVIETTDFYWLGDIFKYYSRLPEWEKRRNDDKQQDVATAQQRKELIIQSRMVEVSEK
jgi:sporulation protein YlmC with PRC-barrel domain